MHIGRDGGCGYGNHHFFTSITIWEILTTICFEQIISPLEQASRDSQHVQAGQRHQNETASSGMCLHIS